MNDIHEDDNLEELEIDIDLYDIEQLNLEKKG